MALPVIFVFTIVIGAILVFLFGFGRNDALQVQSASSFESHLGQQDEQQKKKKNDKKTTKTNKETKIKQEPQEDKEVVEEKPKVVSAKPIQTPQPTPKADKKPKKTQQKQEIVERPSVVATTVMTQSSIVQNDVSASGIWITVEDKRQKVQKQKAQKRLQQQQNAENDTQQQQQQVNKETKESPKLDKKKELTPQPQIQPQLTKQEAQVEVEKTQLNKTDKNKPQEEAKIKQSGIPVPQQIQPPVEALIKDAADDEWILPSKTNKKKSKKKNEEIAHELPSSSSSSIVDNLKQTQLGESIILIDNKLADNNSSSDSVQDIEDGSWASVKPKTKKVRREK